MSTPVTDELLMAVLQGEGCPQPGGPYWAWWEAPRVQRWAEENPEQASDRACLQAALRVLTERVKDLEDRIKDLEEEKR